MIRINYYIGAVLTLFAFNLKAEINKFDKVPSLVGEQVLYLTGMGMSQKNQQDFFIGAFYNGDSLRRPDTLRAEQLAKRMEMRIATDNILPRTFIRYWGYLLRMNNTNEVLDDQQENIKTFFTFFTKKLRYSDHLVFEYDAKGITRIAHNGKIIGKIENAEFFKLLVNSWLGPRPPSEKFKDGILGRNDNEEALRLMTAYQAMNANGVKVASQQND